VVCLIWNSVRPRVSRAQGNSASASLNGQQHAVVIPRSAVVVLIQSPDLRAVRRSLERQLAPGIGVVCVRAGVVCHSLKRAWAEPKVQSRVQGLGGPQMSHLISEVARRKEPVFRNLPLDTQ